MKNQHQEKFEDTKRVIRALNQRRTGSTMTKRKKEKQRSTRHYTEHLSSSNTKPTKNRVWTQVFPKAKQFPLHMWHTSCYACYKHSDKSWM